MDINTEDLKNETKETVNQVKDTLKNVDINKEAKETKGFIKEIFSSPFTKIEKIAKGEEDVFKKAILLLIVNIILCAVVGLITILKFNYGSILKQMWDFIVSVVSPIIEIIVPGILIMVMNKTNKKSLNVITSTLIIAELPEIISGILDIIELLLPKIYLISVPISSTLFALSTVFMYFGMKNLFEEENKIFYKKFILIQLITSFILYVI